MIEAEIEVGWAREVLAGPERPFRNPQRQREWRQKTEGALAAALARIAATEANTERGRAIKAALM